MAMAPPWCCWRLIVSVAIGAGDTTPGLGAFDAFCWFHRRSFPILRSSQLPLLMLLIAVS
jgi:hypothetical protein